MLMQAQAKNVDDPRVTVLHDMPTGSSYFCTERPKGVHPDLLDLYDYWQSFIADTGELPLWADIDLMKIWPIISATSVLDVSRTQSSQLNFHYRFAGTLICEILKNELTGKSIEDVYDAETVLELNHTYQKIVETQQPHIWTRSIRYGASPYYKK